MESNDNTANSAHGAASVSETNTSTVTEVLEWPISPTFLSLREGKEKYITEENANYNNDGIFYADYLRGFLADLSHDKNVQNALSLFQFVPEDFLPYDPNAENPKEITKDPRKATVILNEPLDKKIKEILDRQNKKIIRIDSGTYVNNGELCDDYRLCCAEHTSFCFTQDSTVGIFADEELNKLHPNSDEYYQRLKELIDQLSQDRSEINIIKCEAFPKNGKTKRIYVHYTCPMSRFEEHIFPIYIQERVIACLMFGQVGRENFDNEESFKEYLEEMKIKDSECPNKLLKIKYIDENQWEKKAKAIVERIEIFEKRLEERIEHRNRRYVIEAFEEIEKNFRYSVKDINIKKEDVFSQFTQVLNTAFESVRTKFDDSEDGFIRMFALPISIEHDKLVPIGWAGSDFETKDKAKFALNKLKGLEETLKIVNKKERINAQRRIILDAASKEICDVFDEDKDFFLSGWLAGNEVVFIVWERHSTELRNNTDKIIFKIYRNALKNFYSIAQECYSYIRGARMELLLETTIQESAHESAHFILPAIDVVEQHLYPLPQQMVLQTFAVDYSKYMYSFERYKDEVLESLNQLGEINSGASLIFASDLKLKKAEVNVFYLLYKLKKMLDKRAKEGHQFISYSQSSDYVKANIDVTYFNHALYNLLDNAIKYGYEGSNIYINVNVEKQNKKLIIQVVSYGIGIPKEEENRVYNLFERGLDASKVTRGTGLGMYIVQKVCKAHGGSVSHSSVKLSDYNIPVLFCYKYKNILADRCLCGDISKFEKEIFNLTSKGIEQEVVNDHQFIIFSSVFSSRINMHTYKNIFTITIPLH